MGRHSVVGPLARVRYRSSCLPTPSLCYVWVQRALFQVSPGQLNSIFIISLMPTPNFGLNFLPLLNYSHAPKVNLLNAQCARWVCALRALVNHIILVYFSSGNEAIAICYQGARKVALTSKWCQNSWTKHFQEKPNGKNLEDTVKNPIKLCLWRKNDVLGTVVTDGLVYRARPFLALVLCVGGEV